MQINSYMSHELNIMHQSSRLCERNLAESLEEQTDAVMGKPSKSNLCFNNARSERLKTAFCLSSGEKQLTFG